MPSYGTLRFYRIFDCYHRLDAEKYLFTEWNIYKYAYKETLFIETPKTLKSGYQATNF